MPLSWPPLFQWDSPTGLLLTKLGAIIPAERRTPIILFGSGALQMTIAPSVLSANADIAPDIIPYDPRSKEYPHPLEREELTKLVNEHGMGKGQARTYLHVCAAQTFDPGSRYVRRVATIDQGNLAMTVPHPIDILIAKLHRYDEKDRSDFQEVYLRTGFPTADELLEELRASPRLFDKRDRSLDHLPSQFDESKMGENVPKVFRDLWKIHLSVKRDIIGPAHQALASSVDPGTHQSGIAEIAGTYLTSEQKEPPEADLRSEH